MTATLDYLETRTSTNFFDPAARLSEAEITTLVTRATRAPSSYNMQNWRFIAVRSPEAKARLRALAGDQAKVEEAAVTFIVVGALPDPAVIPERLASVVAQGLLPADVVDTLRDGAAALYGDPQMARDEAIRSATLAASGMMLAADTLGFASCPMIGFDAASVAQDFGLGVGEVPAMLLPVGPAAPGNWPQKARRPVGEVLRID